MMRCTWMAALLLAMPVALAAEVPDTTTPAPAEDATDTAAEAPAAPPDATPRAQYNHALGLLQAGAFEDAAAGFLTARDAAGTDATLRYRAAFNLGLALAGEADAAADAKPAATLATLRSSAAWFQDAARLAPEADDDARMNLELVLKRIERLADSINRGNTLQARLGAIIDDQRGVRDGIRGLLTDIDAQGAGAEPTGFKTEFEALAARERALLAEAAAVADLGAAERGHLDGLDAPTPEQGARRAQLEAMERYLQRARQSLGDARRRLRRLEGERGHRRADAALAELKRAREQLQDPLTTLKAIVRDETALLSHTATLAAFSAGRVVAEEGAAQAAPAWLTPGHLVNRQEDAAARTGATLRHVEAAATPQEGADAAPPAADAAAAPRIREAAAEALPHLSDGLAAMRDAIAALENGTFGAAVEAEAQAVRALNQAIERFADLRGLIELAHADQSQATALLTPPPDDAEAPATPPLSAAERARAVTLLAQDNRERLARMAPLLREALTPPSTAADATDAQGDEEAAQAAARQRHELAETHRTAALRELEALLDTLGAAAPSGAEALPPAQAALGHIKALRRLFFSLVEHLAALIVEQSETHDSAATLQFESQLDRLVPELALVAQRQAEHAATGDALAAALAESEAAQRADAAEPPPPAAPAATQTPDAEALAKATAELRAGAAHMHGANAIMAAAAEAAAASSPDLTPALDEQVAAIERLENALKLLQPPRQDDGDGGDQQAGAQAAQEAAAQPDEEERMSQRQAMRRLQAIRDRDAQRRRDRRAAAPPDPVEKDW